MEGNPMVDNSSQASSPVSAAPAPVATAEPTTQTTPPPAQQFELGSRSPEFLDAILSGADPTSLIKTNTPAVNNEPQPAAAPAPATEPQVPIPDKFKNPDGTPNIEALAKSYNEAQKLIGEQGNKLGQMNQVMTELQQVKGIIQQLQQPQQPAQQQPGQPAPAQKPSEPQLTEEQELELYYENPVAYQKQQANKLIQQVQNLIQEGLKPVAPIVERHNYDQQVEGYSQAIAEFTANGQNPDFYDLMPQMQQIIEKYGNSLNKLPNSVEVIYRMAKGMVPPPVPAPTFEQMVADPNYRQKILSDPAIQAEIKKSYIQEVKQGAPPTVIGAQQGGTPPAAPAEKPTSVREASSIFNRFLRSQ